MKRWLAGILAAAMGLLCMIGTEAEGSLRVMEETAGKKVTWKSSNKKIASVKSGKVTGVKAGKATIYAKTAGKTLTCKVTVKNNDVTAKSVSFTTADGGEFIRGKSTAVLKYTMPSKASLVQIDILDSPHGLPPVSLESLCFPLSAIFAKSQEKQTFLRNLGARRRNSF